jgi:sialic acid synthase
MDRRSTNLVAEIGCVHGGSLDRAMHLISLASTSGAYAVKSQKRNPYKSVPESIRDAPHPNPNFSFGSTYLEHRLNLELSVESHMAMSSRCAELGMRYGVSVWDADSVFDMNHVVLDFIKIPSACCMNFDLIDLAIRNFECQIHVSTGMTTSIQRQHLFSHLHKYASRVVVYHTTSEYPCPFSRLHLLEIRKIIDEGFVAGFSNHGYGIAADIAAMSLGASWIERHFVDDRTYPHTDAAASLEPSGLKTLRRDLDNVAEALTTKPSQMSEEESRQAKKLRSHS